MSQYQVGLIIYGVADPWAQTSTAAVLYHSGTMPATTAGNGYPTELQGATLRGIIPDHGRPGTNWGADPRKPTGQGTDKTIISLVDDSLGTLSTLWMRDPDLAEYVLTVNRLSASALSCSINGLPVPTSGVFYINNEAIGVTVGATTTSATPTTSLTITRGKCGSTARVHVLRPSQTEEGYDTRADRIKLTKKPLWGKGFYAGVYVFKLDQFGAIESYVLRRGVVSEEPTNTDDLIWQVTITLIEDHITAHSIGSCAKVELGYPVIIKHRVDYAGISRADKIMIVLNRGNADRFFDEPCGLLNSNTVDAATVSNLATRLRLDYPTSKWEIVLNISGDTFLYRIDTVAAGVVVGSSSTAQTVQISCTWTGAESPGADIVVGANTKNWWSYAPGDVRNGKSTGTKPTIALRLTMLKSPAIAFTALCVSDDAGTAATYDLWPCGVGASIPVAFLNLGSSVANTASALAGISGATKELLKQHQRNDTERVYSFDLTQPTSMGEWLTNEALQNQYLLGSLQSGLITLVTWVHTVASTKTLRPISAYLSRSGERMVPILRLDLSAGVNEIDLTPKYQRSIMFGALSRAKPEEVQAVRSHDPTVTLSTSDIKHGDIYRMVQVYRRLLGGSPMVYMVNCSLDYHISDGIEIGDAVAWSNGAVATPTGRGISGDFLVVKIDINSDESHVTYGLIKNTLTSTTTNPVSQGRVSPAVVVTNTTPVDSTHVKVEIKRSDGADLVSATDFGGIFDDIVVAGDRIKIANFEQAPIGEKEREGSVEAHAIITAITVSGTQTTLTLEVHANDLRGSFTAIGDLFDPSNTHLVLPDRLPLDVSRPGALIEANATAAVADRNFISVQPAVPISGALHTFGV